MGSNYECFRTEKYIIGNSSLSSFCMGISVIIFVLSIFIIIRKNYVLSENTRFHPFFLPIYNYPVMFIIIISIVIGILNIIGDENTKTEIILYIYTLKWFVYQLSLMSLTLFFMHQGIGSRSIKTSLIVGFLWASLTTAISLIIITIKFNQSEEVEEIGIAFILFISLISFFEVVVWLSPKKLLRRRPAAIFISQAFLLIHVVSFAFLVTIIVSPQEDSAVCSMKVYTKLLDFIQPILLLRSMHLDSMFWQGLYTSDEANLNQPLLGMWDIGRQTLTAVTDCVSVFEKKVINIIPFNYLTLDTRSYIAGGASRVYKGCCLELDRIVAVKILFCMELTPEGVKKFCDEATLLNSMKHQNIVTCYGVSLMPPAISLVTEYCHYGSLYSFLHSYDVVRDSFRDDDSSSVSKENNQRTVRISDVSNISFPSSKLYDSNSSTSSKEHELSARTLSNQIKDSLLSANYSMSSANMMKQIEDAIGNKDDDETTTERLTNATDFMTSKEMRFGLGPEQQLVNRITITNATTNTIHDSSMNSKSSQPMFAYSTSKQTLGNFLPLDFKVKLCYECCNGIAYLHSKGFAHNDIKSLNFLVTKDLTVKLSDLGETRLSNTKIEAKELPTNINWSAPEVLTGSGQVHTSSDIWGLALVMCEVLTGIVPFDLPEYRTLQMNAFALKLKEGLRPEIPKDIRESKYKWLCDLIEQAWVYDATKRISAEYMVREFQQNLSRT